MKLRGEGSAVYILFIGLIILASAVFAGGFRQYNIHLHLNANDTPIDETIPGQILPTATPVQSAAGNTAAFTLKSQGASSSATPVPAH